MVIKVSRKKMMIREGNRRGIEWEEVKEEVKSAYREVYYVSAPFGYS